MRKPDFLIIGSQKSGTTALKYYIAQHPDIWCPTDELHFFDQRLNRGMNWYLKQFEGHNEKLIGEKTPAYMFFENIPPMIKEMNPKIKLIAILREPVSRAYSEYQMIHLKGQVTCSFENLIFNQGLINANRICLRRSMYAKQLKNIYKYFNKNQVLIIKAEDLRENRQETIDKVCKFLGVTTFIPENMSDRHVGGEPKFKSLMKITGFFTQRQHFNRKRFDWITWCDTKFVRFFKHLNRTTNGYTPMKRETRQQLQEFFKPYNKELEKLEGITWQ